MVNTRFSEDVLTLSELKTNTSRIVEHVRRSRRPVLLTRRGHGVAVLVDLAEYERLVDRAAFPGALEEGAAAKEADDLHDHAEAEKILGRFGVRDV